MKYIIGAFVGIGFLASGYAFAATKGASGLNVVDHLDIGSHNTFVKIYDQDANVICYFAQTWQGGEGVGLSCLKNN